MPRRNINAQERVDKKWSPDYIRQLMRKINPEAAERQQKQSRQPRNNYRRKDNQ